ncbi:hypothetical protein NEICINOT_04394 [Neisseria cinerea ATCC 14685]|uniref:Uncharacterized protein n=1 Tax=Neisseria cinerea ATCC 14685 TaxID=546262 RepID=D0W402_NEICI|nr:hypothetical protein NEICINOT_04394 [Neisseria cinerea ATCC 14685]
MDKIYIISFFVDNLNISLFISTKLSTKFLLFTCRLKHLLLLQ